MRFTSPSRRALGLAAASAIGMSTALLGVTGVASAAGPVLLAGQTLTSDEATSFTVGDGVCGINWQVYGAGGGTASDETVGQPGGVVITTTDATAGDVYDLYAGERGGNATESAGGAGGSGYVNEEGAVVFQGEDGLEDDPDEPTVYSGGGGGGSVVVDAQGVFIGAAGGDGGAVEATDWGYGGGYTYSATTDVDSSRVGDQYVGSITAQGVSCTPGAPYLNYVDPGDGEATVNFVAPYDDNGVDVTGYEVTTDDGDSWSALTTTGEDGRLSGTITGLTNETTYTVAVRAVGGTGGAVKGDASQSQTVTPYRPLAAPTNVVVTTTTSRVTISWTAPAGQVKGYDVGISYGQSGDQGCAITDPSVTTCTFFTRAGSDFEVGVRAIDMQDRPGLYASQTGITVPGPATPASVPTKDDGDIVGPAGPISKITAGQKITLEGTGYAPNSTVELLVYSSPVSLGTVVTDENGSFSVEVTVPANLANGTHHLVATGVDPSGNVRNLVIAVTVSGGQAVLATTGFDAVPVAVGGGLVLLAGAGLLVGARRRSNA
ncbi:fibronectin type III domain-containing protein [Klenkia brasiliensis]|uniref:Fibronectin type III domain-containing protein n=1 Tax=Klenkia brasiliensis TaxID=333142 RepID=A0A1G7N5J3_9ACTN|nr:fibronectin type III domain-containing protein [Klenkia brasiliensis]SDF68600.1 hypothetical protein SAMN05660324_0881 [Klenkia brasiliensis]